MEPGHQIASQSPSVSQGKSSVKDFVLGSLCGDSVCRWGWLGVHRVTEPETEGARSQAVSMLPLCLHCPHPTPAWWLGSLLHNCLFTHPPKTECLGHRAPLEQEGQEYSPSPPPVLETCLRSTHKLRKGKVWLALELESFDIIDSVWWKIRGAWRRPWLMWQGKAKVVVSLNLNVWRKWSLHCMWWEEI